MILFKDEQLSETLMEEESLKSSLCLKTEQCKQLTDRNKELQQQLVGQHIASMYLIPTSYLFRLMKRLAIIKSPACLTLFSLETYNLYFIASKLITVFDMRVC